jgi:hypothetical protein
MEDPTACGLGKFSSCLFGSGWSVWLWYRPRSSRSGRVEWMGLGGLCWVASDKIGKLYVSSPSCLGCFVLVYCVP